MQSRARDRRPILAETEEAGYHAGTSKPDHIDYGPAWKTLANLQTYLADRRDPVILLEGTRQLPEEDRPALVALGRLLATQMPTALFRTGNATGSDTAFAEGVALVDARRLQYVLPQSRMGRHRMTPLAYSVSLEQLSTFGGNRVAEATASATPANQRLIAHYRQTTQPTAARAKAAYLLRDTLKVLGSTEAGLAPATLGIFYLNEADPLGGGTGHTIRVCVQHDVPVIPQQHWRGWLVGTATRQ